MFLKRKGVVKMQVGKFLQHRFKCISQKPKKSIVSKTQQGSAGNGDPVMGFDNHSQNAISLSKVDNPIFSNNYSINIEVLEKVPEKSDAQKTNLEQQAKLEDLKVSAKMVNEIVDQQIRHLDRYSNEISKIFLKDFLSSLVSSSDSLEEFIKSTESTTTKEMVIKAIEKAKSNTDKTAEIFDQLKFDLKISQFQLSLLKEAVSKCRISPEALRWTNVEALESHVTHASKLLTQIPSEKFSDLTSGEFHKFETKVLNLSREFKLFDGVNLKKQWTSGLLTEINSLKLDEIHLHFPAYFDGSIVKTRVEQLKSEINASMQQARASRVFNYSGTLNNIISKVKELSAILDQIIDVPGNVAPALAIRAQQASQTVTRSKVLPETDRVNLREHYFIAKGHVDQLKAFLSTKNSVTIKDKDIDLAFQSILQESQKLIFLLSKNGRIEPKAAVTTDYEYFLKATLPEFEKNLIFALEQPSLNSTSSNYSSFVINVSEFLNALERHLYPPKINNPSTSNVPDTGFASLSRSIPDFWDRDKEASLELNKSRKPPLTQDTPITADNIIDEAATCGDAAGLDTRAQQASQTVIDKITDVAPVGNGDLGSHNLGSNAIVKAGLVHEEDYRSWEDYRR